MRVDKRTVAGGVQYQVQANAGLVCFRIVNDTPFDLDLIWGPGGPVSETIAPHTVEDGLVPEQTQIAVGGSRWNGTITVTPVVPSGGTLPNNPPAQQVTIDGYEQVRQRRGYGLSRLQNVGNAAGQAASVANMVQNDGNNAGTTIVESTMAGSTGSNNFQDNQGNLTLREYVGGVLTTIFQVIAGAATGADVVKIGKAGNFFAHVLGKLKVDGASSLDGALLTTDGAGNVTLVGITASGLITAANLIAQNGAVQWANSSHYSILGSDQGGSIELGAQNGVNPGVTQNPYIDFHSSASARDFDVRIGASGGGGADGAGTLTLNAASVVATSNLKMNNGNQVAQILSAGGGSAGVTIWDGTTDPGGSAGEGDIWVKA